LSCGFRFSEVSQIPARRREASVKGFEQNEPAMYKMLLSQERQMATADGLGFTDEEIEANVMKQIENNAFRVALKAAKDNFSEVLMNG